ncbi:MAG: FtsQ-type POTRA domain-containing protein [Epulopiscium sp.]|jgi:cell division protein FtsQ|nr:FtsQ-type POTRA domain-containing protein [Candidatus Epulonipiscium sp.]
MRKKTHLQHDNSKISTQDIVQEGNVTYLPKRRKRGWKEFFSYKVRLFLIIFILIATGILFSPLFQVKHIQVTELQCYSQAEICKKIGLTVGENVFLFGKRNAVKVLEKDPYIEEAKISRKLPDTIVVTIKERKVRGYIPYMGSYLYIDENGRVLDAKKSFTTTRPMVRGLQFDAFELGEILEVDNPESLDIVVKVAQMMTKYQLLDMVVEIDVSDPKQVHAYVNKVDILLGDITDCDQKIKTMAEIMKTIPKEDRGTLDLRDMSKPIIFQYLT